VNAAGEGATPDTRRVRVAWGRIRWALRRRLVLDGSQLPELAEGQDRKLHWYARTMRGRRVPVSIADAVDHAGDEHAGMIVLRTRQAVERGEAGRDVVVGLDLIEPAMVATARRMLAAMSDDLRAARQRAEALMHLAPHPPTGDGGDPVFAEVVYELHRQIDRAETLATSYRDLLDGARSVLDNPQH
jgi:hypothetical protein